MTDGNGKSKGNFSGFLRNFWRARDSDEHIRTANLVKVASCEADRKRLESDGSRWSELFRLPYFRPIEHHTIDPMHCLFLGISKTMTKHYLKSGIINKINMGKIQDSMDKIRVPSTVGRIPYKIASGFASFTADQWRNWTVVYSTPILKDFIATEHFSIWKKYVHATSILSRKIISVLDVNIADDLLLSFCASAERTYGEGFITPNFHMSCHLADVIRSFGPVYGYWCFSFER